MKLGDATTVHRSHLRHGGAGGTTRNSAWRIATIIDFGVLLIGVVFWIAIDVAANPHRASFEFCSSAPVAKYQATARISLVDNGTFRVEIPSTRIVGGPSTKIHHRCTSSEMVSLVSGTVARDPNALVEISAPENEPWHHVQTTLTLLLQTGAKYASLTSTGKPAFQLVPRREPSIVSYVFRATAQ